MLRSTWYSMRPANMPISIAQHVHQWVKQDSAPMPPCPTLPQTWRREAPCSRAPEGVFGYTCLATYCFHQAPSNDRLNAHCMYVCLVWEAVRAQSYRGRVKVSATLPTSETPPRHGTSGGNNSNSQQPTTGVGSRLTPPQAPFLRSKHCSGPAHVVPPAAVAHASSAQPPSPPVTLRRASRDDHAHSCEAHFGVTINPPTHPAARPHWEEGAPAHASQSEETLEGRPSLPQRRPSQPLQTPQRSAEILGDPGRSWEIL